MDIDSAQNPTNHTDLSLERDLRNGVHANSITLAYCDVEDVFLERVKDGQYLYKGHGEIKLDTSEIIVRMIVVIKARFWNGRSSAYQKPGVERQNMILN